MINIKRGKAILIVLAIFAFLIIFNQAALAQGAFVDDFIQRVGQEGFAPIFAALFGTSTFDEFLFAKILLFFIFFSVIFISLKNVSVFENNQKVVVVITIAVSILSIRFMGDSQFIRGVLLPYSVLGVAISVILPLLIYAAFVQTSFSGKFGRRFAWFLYAAIFFILWMSRASYSDEINWIYGLGFLFIIINLIFDGPIHEYLGSQSFRKARLTYHLEEKGRYAQKLQELEQRRHLYKLSEYEKLKKEFTNRYIYHTRKS